MISMENLATATLELMSEFKLACKDCNSSTETIVNRRASTVEKQ